MLETKRPRRADYLQHRRPYGAYHHAVFRKSDTHRSTGALSRAGARMAAGGSARRPARPEGPDDPPFTSRTAGRRDGNRGADRAASIRPLCRGDGARADLWLDADV